VDAPPWHVTGPLDRPFDFIGHIRRLCADICQRCAELRHIDTRRILFDMTQARNNLSHGLQARVTPLRFRHGHLRRTRQQVVYQVQRYLVDGNEMLYLVTFCLPRFLDQTFDEKFITLFHELYHISPHFEGDLRHHDGRNHLHADSKQAYDRHMAQLAREYLASKPDPALHGFLRLNFAQLMHRHKRVEAIVVPRPRLIPVGKVSDLCGLETAS
jgi:predicted metallopeptidase